MMSYSFPALDRPGLVVEPDFPAEAIHCAVEGRPAVQFGCSLFVIDSVDNRALLIAVPIAGGIRSTVNYVHGIRRIAAEYPMTFYSILRSSQLEQIR